MQKIKTADLSSSLLRTYSRQLADCGAVPIVLRRRLATVLLLTILIHNRYLIISLFYLFVKTIFQISSVSLYFFDAFVKI